MPKMQSKLIQKTLEIGLSQVEQAQAETVNPSDKSEPVQNKPEQNIAEVREESPKLNFIELVNPVIKEEKENSEDNEKSEIIEDS